MPTIITMMTALNLSDVQVAELTGLPIAEVKVAKYRLTGIEYLTVRNILKELMSPAIEKKHKFLNIKNIKE